MLPYAEEFLMQAGKNQWFVRFFGEANDLTAQAHKSTQHMWFQNRQITLTEVRTTEYDLPQTNFYHVHFQDVQDVNLAAYSEEFEDSTGVSLHPEYYQMYEWSFDAWKESGGQQLYETRLASPVSAEAQLEGPTY